MRSQLKLAGDAIARIAQIIQDRAWLTIEEIHQGGNAEGPIMPPGAFDRFVRQSMQVNLAPFVEVPPVPLRAPPVGNQSEFPDDGRSVVAEIDQAALLEVLEAEPELDESESYNGAIAIAHSENVQDWISAIQQYFAAQPQRSIPLADLTRAMNDLSAAEDNEPRSVWVNTWLALLLGEYRLEQRGEFYQAGNPLGNTGLDCDPVSHA